VSFPVYPEYKNSGIDWLQEVPKAWEIKPLKYLLNLNPRKSDFDGDKQQLCSFVPMEKLKTGEVILDEQRPIEDVIGGYTFFQDGDVLQAKVTPCFENKNVALAKELINGVGFGSSEINVLRPKDQVDPKYLFYRVQEDAYMEFCTSSMIGAGGLRRVPSELINNFAVAVPTIKEQTQIARFLDHETAKIDALIHEQERLIELLQEKRQAVISHAVTKGLAPGVPMKDSGVEWLGEVPAHWQMIPLKYLCSFSGGGTPAKENLEYWNGEIPWVSPKDMKSLWISASIDRITNIAVAESSTSLVKPNAVLMVVRSGILQRTIPVGINIVDVTLNQDMKALRFFVDGFQRYFVFLIKGFEPSWLLEWRKQGATVESIEQEYLAESLVPVPPIEEADAIVSKMDGIASQYQSLEDEARNSSKLLKERRSVLISAAVTGKIDVRDWQPPADESAYDEEVRQTGMEATV